MSNVLWTAQMAARATGGTATGEWSVTGISIDTRSLKPGDLFVPLKDNRDGHDFIPQAYADGAGAVISEQPIKDQPALIVDDSFQALQALGGAARDRSKAVRIAITGSVGKTSLKEAIWTLCSTFGRTHKSLKSFNNHWGVPFTMATMPQATQFGVFEVGMNHAGELSALSELICPDIAVITKIAPAHLAHFENVDAIAEAKSEIFDGLVISGTAILNADDPYFAVLKQKAEDKGAQVLSVGYAKDADFQISDLVLKPSDLSATLNFQGESHPMTVGLAGEHWAFNAACAVAVAVTAGVPTDVALKGLEQLKPIAGRGEVLSLDLDGKAVTLIDESYNANPESMRAAIAVLGGTQSEAQTSGRKLAVLGDMYELGKDELDLHAKLAAPLEAAGVDRIIVTGECMLALRGAVPRAMRGAWVRDWRQAYEALLEEIEDGDTVLVKGSNATGLGRLVNSLKTGGPV